MHQHNPTPAFRRSFGLTVATTTAAALTVLLPAIPAAAAPEQHVVGAAAVAAAVTTPSVDTVAAGTWATAPTESLSRATADMTANLPLPTVKTASAMSRAMSKIGSPYRWGATGPNAFDCSGLVSWAYKQVGVSLPRSSRAMAQVGTPVSKSQLRPGDLVFFYKPVSHVAMYIGNGKVVHASTSGQPVKISDMSRMPFNSARRV